MPAAPIPANEHTRLRALLECHVLDTEPESAFDDLTKLAARLCDAPIALVSLVDAERQWFKSTQGLEARETHRDMAFCAHAIHHVEPLIIRDATTDERTLDNALVTSDPAIRFYAGVPLVTQDGFALGTLCVIDVEPRDISPSQLTDLIALARQAASQLELRRRTRHLEAANDQLSTRNQELDEFTYVASHDLQEPIRKLISFSKLLEMDAGGDLNDKARRDLHFITDAAARMQQLVQDLLQLSRAGRSAMKPERIPLEDCVNTALDALSMCIAENDAQICHDPLPVVYGDRTMLTQLYQNLISNAVKFRVPERRPVIQLTVQEIAEGWRLGVRDNGIGIKPEHCEQVFAPFKRLHGRGDYAGTGIGLAICKKTVERHGGLIEVTSEPGEGAHFSFTIPNHEEKISGQTEAEDRSSSSSMTIPTTSS